MNEFNFLPLPGQSGDEAEDNTINGAFEARRNLPMLANDQPEATTSKIDIGSIFSGFVDSFLNNIDARALNNQSIAEYNQEQAKRARQRQTNIAIMVIVLVFIFIMTIAIIKKKK